MRLRTKIVIPIATFSSTLALLFGLFFLSLRHIQSQIIHENETVQQIVEVSQELSTLQQDIDYNMTLFAVTPKDEYLKNIQINRNRIPLILEKIQNLHTSAQELELMSIYERNRENLLIIETDMITAIRSQNRQESNTLFAEWLSRKNANSQVLKTFTVNSLKLLQRNQLLIDEVLQRLFYTGVGIFIFTFILIMLLVFYLRRIITRPVKQLARAARKISEAKFDEALITYTSDDELGQLSDSIRYMSKQLQKSYKLLNREVKVKTQELLLQQKLEKQKDDFIAIASHELRTPITSQKAFIQLLQRELDKNKDTRYLPLVDKISSQTNKLTKLITDLLDVSKMSIGKLEIKKNPYDYNLSVRKVVEDIQQMKPKHKIIIKGKVSKLVNADQSRIQQVLSNIILNAIKYSPGADKVIVTIVEKPIAIITSVQDFGIGIDTKYNKRIFERFYRIKSHGENSFTGMGIGLNISSEIIKLHNGKIWVESEKDKGSIFYFTLPLQ